MTAQTLRQMSHETLVRYVRARVAGPIPAAMSSATAVAEDPHRGSIYRRDTRVPAARIQPYPKRRAPRTPRHDQFIKPATTLLWDAMNPNDLPTPRPAELRYEDFLRTETRTLATSAS